MLEEVKNLLLYILFNCATLFINKATAQIVPTQPSNQYIISHRLIALEQGLASKNVYCGLVDDEGFIWLGTEFGLNRYDGNKFQLFTTNQGLKHNKVIGLCKDNNGHLLITYGGSYQNVTEDVDVLDLKTMKTVSFESVFPKLPFLSKNIVGVYSDQTSDVYFMVQKPLKLWKYSNNEFKLYAELKDWWDYEKADSNVFARKKGEMFFFNKGNITLTYNLNFASYIITPNKQTTIDKKYFIGNINASGEVLYYTRTSNHNQKNYSYRMSEDGNIKGLESSNEIEDILFREGGINMLRSNVTGFNYYLNTNPYCIYFTTKENNYTLLDTASCKVYGKPIINNSFEDKFGNLWLCTSNGLLKITIKKNKFKSYFTNNQLKNREQNSVRGIYADNNGNVYGNVGLSLYKNNKMLVSTIGEYKDEELLYGLHLDDQNNLTATIRKGFLHFNEKQDKKFKYTDNVIDKGGEEIWCITKVSNNNWLCGSNEHFYTYNESSKRFEYVKYAHPEIPLVKFAYRIIKTKNKQWWAVAESGLYQLNASCDSIMAFWGSISAQKNATQLVHNLPIHNLYDFYEDDNEVFWIATNGEGLYRWDRISNTLKQFTIADGLSSNVLYRIEADNLGKLWVSSNYGLNCFDTKNNFVNTYTTKKGITHNEFNRISSYKAKNGFLYFGGLDGVNQFNPTDFINEYTYINAPLSIVSYNQFIGDNNQLVNQTIQLKSEGKIVLNPNDKFFILEFKLLNYEDEQQRYAYKIEGIGDSSWNYINENSIRISGLPYGKFTLNIKGQNLDGNWSSHHLIIPLEVLKPFYLKLWFIGFVIFALGGLVYAFIKYRIKKLDKENIRLEQVVAKRTADLNNALHQKDGLIKEVHHRVKNNLQVIIAMLRMQSRTVADKAAIDALLDSENRLQAIAMVHEKLYKSNNFINIELKDYLRELMQALVKQYHNENIAFSFSITDNYNISTSIDAAIPIGLIVNELVTNSFKYAFNNVAKGEINIVLNKTNNQYQLTIQDNGDGLPNGELPINPKSLGLKLVHLFTEQLNGSLAYITNKGACFTVVFH